MKGLTEISRQTAPGKKIPLYYSIKKDTVYTEAGAGRFYITDLINPNSPEDIKNTVNFYMSL